MENLSKQNNIEEIKNAVKNLTPEEMAEKLKRARELQEQKKNLVFGGTKQDDLDAINVKGDLTYAIEDNLYDDSESKIDFSGGVRWPFKGKYEFVDKFLLNNGGDKFYNRITEVNGTVWFNGSEKFEFNNLHTIAGDAMFKNSEVQALPNLEKIGGNARFSKSEVQSLPNLTTVGGTLECIKGKAVELPKLTTVNGNFVASSSKLASVPCLKEVGGDADFVSCKSLKELPNLEKIGGDAIFDSSGITSLPKLTTIGGYADFCNTGIKELPELTQVNGHIYLSKGQFIEMPKLKNCECIIFKDAKDHYARCSLEKYRKLLEKHKAKAKRKGIER